MLFIAESEINSPQHATTWIASSNDDAVFVSYHKKF